MKVWNMWWFRIIFDILIVLIGLGIVTIYQDLSPRHLPNSITPKDLSLPYKDIKFLAADGCLLSGWLILSPSAKGTIICCHGYPANKSDILPAIKFLYPEFNHFLFDFRAHGDSQGRLVTFGLRESRDISGAIRYIKKSPEMKDLPLGIWGYSLGGAVAIKSSIQNKEIKAIVTDSTYADFPEMVYQYYGGFGPFKYLAGFLPRFLSNFLIKGGLSQLSPENIIGYVRCPILIMHSKDDPFVPARHAKRLYQRANEPKELLILEGISHGAVSNMNYKEKVAAFFEKWLWRNGG